MSAVSKLIKVKQLSEEPNENIHLNKVLKCCLVAPRSFGPFRDIFV